jgi:DNA mismatch endonuclease, patch repair protein
MADVFTKEKRSEIMSRIRSKETGLERAAFAYLRRQGIYFQKHYPRAPGKPDIALPSRKTAVFIDGDFWHGFRYPRWKNRIPKTYWRSKIESNIERDRKNFRALRRRGWKVLRIWGHQLKNDPAGTFERIANFLMEAD